MKHLLIIILLFSVSCASKKASPNAPVDANYCEQIEPDFIMSWEVGFSTERVQVDLCTFEDGAQCLTFISLETSLFHMDCINNQWDEFRPVILEVLK